MIRLPDIMPKLFKIIAALTLFTACGKVDGDRIDYDSTLRFYQNDIYQNHENFFFFDQYDCWFEFTGDPQQDSSGLARYHFGYSYAKDGYEVSFKYAAVDNNSHFIFDNDYPDRRTHQSMNSVAHLFTPQAIPFATHPDSAGFYLVFKQLQGTKTYTSIPPSSVSTNPNNDERFYFRFIQHATIDTNQSPNAFIFPNAKYLISARGQFAAVLYTAEGDSMVISGGEFRLPFCE